MKVDNIIIQAGGIGSRLGKLTSNKPKSLVPINNRPILFHAFEQYPSARFIIIGDYKFSILENYLSTFANVDYKLVSTIRKGNAAGINLALEFIAENTPFLLLWSDILLSKDLDFNRIPDDNYIGLTSNYLCSWHMSDGVLQKEQNDGRGVEGFFFI